MCLTALLSIALVGCGSDITTHRDQADSQSSALTSGLKQAQAPTLSKEGLVKEKLVVPPKTSLSPHAAELAETVQRSQARLAASTPGICPKLIEFKVGSSTSLRLNEVMKSKSCKYFIYPKAGEILAAEVSHSGMKVSLVQPMYFNFANGTYRVNHAGKHVIEITFDGYQSPTTPKPRYNFSVSRS